MKKIKFTRENLILSLILILSAILNLTNLKIEEYANEYYAAGVKSMTMSLKNFFFVSFDPAGFVSIDKSPLGFWIQAISAKIFGFSGWSIILPQAIAGVISVGLIYSIVKRTFGSTAGLISALCLAITPVFVAVSRNNTVDNLLVMTLLFACLALSKAAEKGKLKYLIISLIIVGIGFNIKMLQAYMIVPALYITYLISSALPVKKRVVHLMAGTAVLILVSLSWAIAVDLVPAGSRPYVGSSTNNTVMELILGHNGLKRLGIGGTGTDGGMNRGRDGQAPGQFNNGADANSGASKTQPGQTPFTDSSLDRRIDANSSASKSQPHQGTFADPSRENRQGPGVPGGSPGQGKGMPGGFFNANNQDGMKPAPQDRNMQSPMGGGMGGAFGGEEKASITRLFSKNSLSDQITWFLPLAVFGFVGAALREKLKSPFDNGRKLALILWSMWLLPEFIYFSYTKGLFHPYYLTMLAPPVAALTGIGLVSLWQLYKEGGWKSYLLPAALIADELVQILLLSYYYNISSIAKIIMLMLTALCFVSSVMLIIVNMKNKESVPEGENAKLKKILISTALTGLLIAPLVWSSTPMFYKMSGTFPSAGLGLVSNRQMGSLSEHNIDKLIQFLQTNRTNEKYLVAVPSATSYASDIIIKTGESVMALGGFSGSDNIITLSEFKQLVNDGAIRYAIVNGGGPGGNNEIMNWIKENGKLVSESEWSGSNISSSEAGSYNSNDKNSSQFQNQKGSGMIRRNPIELYDLKANKDNTRDI